jgi:hypothetical protein
MSKVLLEGDDWKLIETTFDYLVPNSANLSEAQKPVVYLVTAHGIMENGGLRYFLESDFPDHVSHDEVAKCYVSIGMPKAYEIIKSSFRIFPGSTPPSDLPLRSRLLESEHSAAVIEKLDADFFSQAEGFEHALATYIRANMGLLAGRNEV